MIGVAGGAVLSQSSDEIDPKFMTPAPPAVAGRYEAISEQYAPSNFEAQVCKKNKWRSSFVSIANNRRDPNILLACMCMYYSLRVHCISERAWRFLRFSGPSDSLASGSSA